MDKPIGKEMIRVIPLGGMKEIGKNMTLIEYKDEILIIDCGTKFPDEEMYGIDIIIPDITYLKKNKAKIKGIVLTHGHEDHIGALPYVLQEINVPVYGTRLTLGLVRRKFQEFKAPKALKLIEVKHTEKIKLGSFEVEFLKVSHSIPDASALAIRTPMGVVIHTGDFKIDYTPIDEKVADLGSFSKYGNEGVLLLMADSTNAERIGHSMSESSVGKRFDDIFHQNDRRIIVASFASNIHRIQQIINAACLNNRKVAFAGRSMVNVTEVACELGYLTIPEDTVISLADVNQYPDESVCIVTTGSQGEPLAALSRMANGEHRQVAVKPGDLVVFSSTPIPGNEKDVKKNIDNLMKRGAEVIYESMEEVHVSGHACQEELKLIHALVRPQYFIPAHGEFHHLKANAQLAEKMGVAKEAVMILDIGQVAEIANDGIVAGSPVPSGSVLLDGIGLGDVGNIVLRDRKVLAEEGLILAIVTLDKTSHEILSGPDIISRGFVYMRDSEDLMQESRLIVIASLEKCKKRKKMDWTTYKTVIKDDLNNYYYQKLKRRPVVLPILVEI